MEGCDGRIHSRTRRFLIRDLGQDVNRSFVDELTILQGMQTTIRRPSDVKAGL